MSLSTPSPAAQPANQFTLTLASYLTPNSNKNIITIYTVGPMAIQFSTLSNQILATSVVAGTEGFQPLILTLPPGVTFPYIINITMVSEGLLVYSKKFQLNGGDTLKVYPSDNSFMNRPIFNNQIWARIDGAMYLIPSSAFNDGFFSTHSSVIEPGDAVVA